MIYDKLRDLQKQNNLTNMDVAKAVGRSRQWYNDIFINKSLKIEDLRSLAEYYKVDIKEFFENSYKKGDFVFDPSLKDEYSDDVKELVKLNRKSLEALLDLTMQVKTLRDENIALKTDIDFLEKEVSELKK